jgi:DNA-binding MarR family transcriptional regulator
VDNKGYDYQGDTKKAKNAVYASLKRLEKRGLIQRDRDADSLAYFIPELDPYRSGE